MFRIWKTARSVISEALTAGQRSSLEQFKETWKHISDLIVYCEQHEEKPVHDTTLPKCMETLIDVLNAEEASLEGETGPCMEYMFSQDIIKMLIEIGITDVPQGMRLLVLTMMTKLLGSMQQPILPHRSVFPYLQSLLQECIRLSSEESISQEDGLAMMRFNCAICGKLYDDPNFSELFVIDQGKDFLLLTLAVQFLNSPDKETSRLAHEAVALCVHLGLPVTDAVIVEHSSLLSTLTDVLLALFAELPQSIPESPPEFVDQISSLASRGLKFSWRHRKAAQQEGTTPFKALAMFLEEMDFVDHISVTASSSVAEELENAFLQRFLQPVMESKLIQGSEGAADMATTYLTLLLEELKSRHLLQAISRLALSDHVGATMIARCDDMSDQLSMTTLLFFHKLLSRHQQHAFHRLMGRHMHHSLDLVPHVLTPRQISDRLSEVVPAHLRTSPEGDGARSYFDTAVTEMQVAAERCEAWLVCSGDGADGSDADQSEPSTAASGVAGDSGGSKGQVTTADGDDDGNDGADVPVYATAKPCVCDSPFLKVLLSRLSRVFDQAYQINLLVTALVTQLLQYPCRPLRQFLLSTHHASLLTLLEKLSDSLVLRASRPKDAEEKLKFFRSELISGHQPRDDNAALYQAIILLEEFAKELSAIVLVDANNVILT